MTSAFEEWRTISGFADYEVSNFGNVRLAVVRNNRPCGYVMKQKQDAGGYLRVSLSGGTHRKTVLVHRLVCIAFHGEPQAGQEVAHIDGNPRNNRSDNLSWATKSENQRHRVAHGTDSRGARHPMSRLSEAQVRLIRFAPKEYGSGARLARQFGVTPAAISAIRNGKLWSHMK